MLERCLEMPVVTRGRGRPGSPYLVVHAVMRVRAAASVVLVGTVVVPVIVAVLMDLSMTVSGGVDVTRAIHGVMVRVERRPRHRAKQRSDRDDRRGDMPAVSRETRHLSCRTVSVSYLEPNVPSRDAAIEAGQGVTCAELEQVGAGGKR